MLRCVMNYLSLIHVLVLFNHTKFSPQISAKTNILKNTLWEMCLWLQPKGEITHSLKTRALKASSMFSRTHSGLLDRESLPILSSVTRDDANNLPTA